MTLHDNLQPKRGCLYIRSAYRNDPDFNASQINRLPVPSEGMSINRSIENDQKVSENYQRLVYQTIAGIYDETNDLKSVGQFREEMIGAIRNSMRRVFGDLLLNNISHPLESGAFYFEKGQAKNYHYKNLSGGEKSAFDLILDLHIKKEHFADAIYCIDEVETHLHTRVQGAVLEELVDVLPETAQLWVTTHSLGVIRAAQRIASKHIGSVCLLDFEGIEPDESRELLPSSLDRVAWGKILSLALDDLSNRIVPRVVVVCEGSRTGNRRRDFDAEIYSRVISSHHPDISFTSGGGASEARAAGELLRAMLGSVSAGTVVTTLTDRDDRSQIEVDSARASGALVLERRNIEGYLLAEDVLRALVDSVDKPDALGEVLELRTAAIKASVARGNPADDMKSVANDIYLGVKRVLSLTRCGGDPVAFMRDTLAPLLKPGMDSFEELNRCVVEPALGLRR